MKYLLVFAVLWFAIWLWRRNRREEMQEARRERAARPGPGLAAPQAMLRCAHCGLHLPANEAIGGPGHTVYCSVAHRQAAERG